MNLTCRKAVEGPDYTAILNLLLKFADEHQMGTLSARTRNMEKAVHWIIEHVRCATWVVENDGKVIGSLGLRLTTPWYSDTEYYADGWFYVDPEHRKSHAGSMLLEEAKKFSGERNKPLVVGLFTLDDIERKIKMLQRRGFKLGGGIFLFGE